VEELDPAQGHRQQAGVAVLRAEGIGKFELQDVLAVAQG
jgi:hypothetical protein